MPAREGLRFDRMINDNCARAVADGKGRYVGVGTVPLQDPALAAGELTRCMRELGLKGVTISTTVGETELGEKILWPFWSKAEELGAVVYIHPAGNLTPRFRKWQLWNCVGQNFEETMAIASLFYEGVLDAFPALKICISHGGGYMPFNLARVTRNYIEKPTTRVNMKKSPAEYLKMLYYDTCIYEPELLVRLVERVGAGQIVMGSDYPVGEMKPVEFVLNAPGLSEADKAGIIGLNAARLLGVSVPRRT
jgi:aminocarboxymuconate-semialdehyde decarboxylase